jgi:hypothetical protein
MNRGSRWIHIAAFVGILFLTVIVAAYYVPHKPFDVEFIFSCLHALRDILIALAILSLAGGVGSKILGQIHPNRLANLSLQAAFGLGTAAIFFIIVGLLGLYESWFAWICLILLIFLFRSSIRDWIGGWSEVLSSIQTSSLFGKILAGIICAIVLYRLLEALAPPIHFDALVYHFWLPAEFLEAGKFIFTPENPYWGMPLSSELLYTWAMALGSPQSAAVLGWFLGLVTLVGILGLGSTLHHRAGWVAIAVLLTGETAASSLGWAYADWGAALQGVALLIALDAWRLRETDALAALAGLFAGFAFGCKYTAGAVIPAGLALILCHRTHGKRKKAFLYFTMAALVMVVIWLGKNLLYTKAILYPFLGDSPWMDPLKSVFYKSTVSAWPPLRILLTPLSATLEGVEGAPGFSASIGPLLIGLVFGLLFVDRKDLAFVRSVGVFVVVGWLIWAGATIFNAFLGQSRLYFAIFPAWAILAAAGFEGFARMTINKIRLERIAGAFVLLAFSLTGVVNLQEALEKKPLSVVLGVESQQAYLTRNLGAYFPAMEAVQKLSQGSVTLALWEARGFYCRPTCLADTWIDRWYVDRKRIGGEDAILESWRIEGFTHILLYRAGVDFVRENDSRYTEEDWEALERLLNRLELIETFGDGYELYGLS